MEQLVLEPPLILLCYFLTARTSVRGAAGAAAPINSPLLRFDSTHLCVWSGWD